MVHGLWFMVYGLWFMVYSDNKRLFSYLQSVMILGHDQNKWLQRFEAFKKCRAFAKNTGILLRTSKCKQDQELVHQVRKALISILANFAEGYEREGNKEFVQFLATAKGSIGEVRAQLIWAFDQDYLTAEQYQAADKLGEEATNLVGGLMSYLSKSGMSGRKFVKATPR